METNSEKNVVHWYLLWKHKNSIALETAFVELCVENIRFFLFTRTAVEFIWEDIAEIKVFLYYADRNLLYTPITTHLLPAENSHKPRNDNSHEKAAFARFKFFITPHHVARSNADWDGKDTTVARRWAYHVLHAY